MVGKNQIFTNIIKEFKNQYDTIKGMDGDRKIYEIELIDSDPSFKTLGHLNDPNINLNKKKFSFVEYILKKENYKIRSRIPFDTIGGIEIRNNELLEYNTNIHWEEKKLVKVWTEKDQERFMIKTCTEKPTVINSIKTYVNNISIYFVNIYKIKFGYFIIDFKIKYYLGSAHQNSINLYKNLTYPNSLGSLTLEFEYDGDFSETSEKVARDLEKILTFTYEKNPYKIYQVINYPLVPGKCHFIGFKELLTIDYNEFCITSKVDGRSTGFRIENGLIYYLEDRNLWYESLVNCPPEISLTGEGELYLYPSGERCIYPFRLEMDDGNIIQSMELQDYIKNNFDDNLIKGQKPNDSIFIRSKLHVGDFVDRQDFFAKIYQMYINSYPYATDGVVLTKKIKIPGTTVLDFKSKVTYDIDVLTRVMFEYSAKSDPRYSDVDPATNEKAINLKLGTYLNVGNRLKLDREFKLFLGEKYFYEPETFCVSCYGDNCLEKFITVPIAFIAETRVLEPNYCKIRPDKTTILYNKKRSYYGNGIKVIEYIMKSSKDKFNIEHFKAFSENPNMLEQIENKIPSTLTFDEKDPMRLNKKGKYFKSDRVRSILGIISNYIKTLIISLYASKTYYNNKQKATVLGIDFGNGADLSKYFYAGAGVLIATDPDSAAIETAMGRYMNLNTNSKSSYYKMFYINSTPRSSDYVNDIKAVTNQLGFDIIDWNFAIHYSWHDKHIDTVMNNLIKLSKPLTRVCITTMDGTKILNKLKTKEKLTFKIHPTHENGYMEISKKGEEIFVINAPLTMESEMEEYIVKPYEMEQVFKKYGFQLIDSSSFADIYFNDKDFLETVSRYETRPSTKKFFGDQRLCLKDLPNTDIEELLDIFIYYVYQKI